MVADKSLAAEIEAVLEECNIDTSRGRMGSVTVNAETASQEIAARIQSRAFEDGARKDEVRDLADAACFHFFCCGAGIHTQEDECGQMVPSMAALARAINFRNDPATNAEIAAVPLPSSQTALPLQPEGERNV